MKDDRRFADAPPSCQYRELGIDTSLLADVPQGGDLLFSIEKSHVTQLEIATAVAETTVAVLQSYTKLADLQRFWADFSSVRRSQSTRRALMWLGRWWMNLRAVGALFL